MLNGAIERGEMKAGELAAVGKAIEEQEQDGSTLVGLLLVKKVDKGTSGWTLVFPGGISPEFQAHVLECLGIDPSRVQITQTPPIQLEELAAEEDVEEDEEDDEEEGSEGGNDFHTKFGGDP